MKSTPKSPARTPGKPAAGKAAAGKPSTVVRAPNSAAAQDFFRGMVSEMKRVTWPSREEWVAATILTVALRDVHHRRATLSRDGLVRGSRTSHTGPLCR